MSCARVSKNRKKRSLLRRGSDVHVEIDAAVFYFDREGPRAAFVGAGGLSVFQVDDPVVQRAGDLAAMHDAVGQGAAFVRAAVLEREHLVACRAEDRDLPARRSDRACAARWDRIQRADVEPEVFFVFHGLAHSAATGSTGRIGSSTASGMNSCSSRPAARSAHGSLRTAYCDFLKRSSRALRPSWSSMIAARTFSRPTRSTHFQTRSR